MGKHKGNQESFLDQEDDSLDFDFEDQDAEFMFDLEEEEDEHDSLARKRKAARKKPRTEWSIDDDEWSEYSDPDRW